MPGQVVVRRVATAKKQEAETVIIIVRTSIQVINPTLEPVMRVTVSCVKINENIIFYKQNINKQFVYFKIVEKYSKLI